jgi:hypothetical protein
MPWWAWFLVGIVVGATGYLLVGNAVAFRRLQTSATAAGQTYIATRTRGRTVNFKGEDEADGEEVGPVFVTDDDDPEFVHEIGWMKISDARELARDLGHAFNAD